MLKQIRTDACYTSKNDPTIQNVSTKLIPERQNDLATT